MIDNVVRDLQVLWKADALIGKIWLNVIARRSGLFAFAGLIAVFGLGMANVAGFYGLQPSWGSVWAATMVAAADFVLAAVIALLARSAKPGPEIELALEVRKMAVESLQADTRDLKITVDMLGHDMRQAKDAIAGFVHNPLSVATDKLLVPAALSIIRGLRAKKDGV
ncbi:MAG TPA: phage holin family protein [Xanthobacteraceae bacterium]|nr:phage holin family protein [Xanthobacteraceae bacterium]